MLQKEALNTVDFDVEKAAATELLCIRPKDNGISWNLLICSVAYDVLNKTLLLPSQDIKKVHQEHAEVKAVKIGTMVLPNTSRLNPDSQFWCS